MSNWQDVQKKMREGGAYRQGWVSSGDIELREVVDGVLAAGVKEFRTKLAGVLGRWSDEVPSEALLDEIEELVRQHWPTDQA